MKKWVFEIKLKLYIFVNFVFDIGYKFKVM